MKELKFGFLSVQTLQEIDDLGNWKVRSQALQQVQQGLSTLSDKTDLIQQLGNFAEFLLQLLQDHNFKVAIAGLDMLAGVATSLGSLLQPHLGTFAPELYKKLLDQRPPVATAAIKACSSILRHALPSCPLPLLSRLFQQHEQQLEEQRELGTVAQHQLPDCSGLVEVLILAQLSYPAGKLDAQAAARLLLDCLVPSPHMKQQALALEGLAVLTDALGPQLPPVLKQAGAAEVVIAQILQQTHQLPRPVLAADGTVQHSPAVVAAVAAAAASESTNCAAKCFSTGGIPAGSLSGITGPTLARSRSGRSFGGISAGAAALDPSDLSLSKFAALQLAGHSITPEDATPSSTCSSRHSPHSPAADRSPRAAGVSTTAAGTAATRDLPSPASRLNWTVPIAAVDSATRPLNGSTVQQQREQQLQHGSLGALAAHAQLIQRAGGSVSASGADQTSLATCVNATGKGSSMPGRHDLSYLLSSRPQLSQFTADQLDSCSTSCCSPSPPISSPLASMKASTAGWGVTGSIGVVRASLSSSSRRTSAESADILSAAGSTGVGIRSSVGGSFKSTAAATVGSGNVAAGLSNSVRSSAASSSCCSSTAANVVEAQLKLDLPKSRFFGEETLLDQLASSAVMCHGQQQSAGGHCSVQPATCHNASQPPLQLDSTSNSSRCQSPASPTGNGTVQQQLPKTLQQGMGPLLQGQPPVMGIGSGHRSPDLWCVESAVQPSGGSGSSSWLDAGGGGCSWAQLPEGSADSKTGSSSGRPETLSPSRGERLAQLKRRQNEKRGSSASGGARPMFTAGQAQVSLQSTDCTAAAGTAGDGVCRSGSWAAAAMDLTRHTTTSSSRDCGMGPEGASANGIPPRMPSPLLNWQLQLAPDARQQPPQHSMHGTIQQTQQQQQLQTGTSGLAHIRTSPVGQYTGSSEGGSRYDYSSGSSINSAPGGPVPRREQQLQQQPQLVAGRGGQGHSFSAAAAEVGTVSSPSAYSPSTLRTASAAAVLTGAANINSGAIGHSNSSSNGSPLGGSRRLGSSTLSGQLPPSSASPDLCNRRTSHQQQQGSPAYRAQTAAAAFGLNSNPDSEWGSARPGICESPNGSAAGGSPKVGQRIGTSFGRRGVVDRPSTVSAAADAELAELAPLPDPEASLRQAIVKCQQSNTANRKELDWQGQLEALVDARRLLAHHPEVLLTACHELVLAALPAVEELRSTTAKVALQLFQELPAAVGRALDRELDDIVPVLLKKAGELSTAGRDNFLAAEADKALSALWGTVSDARAFSALLASGTSHKSPHVRCRAAAHLDEVAAGGQGLEGLVRGNWALLDRLFKAAASFLQEGSLDTRTYGKRLLWAVKSALHGSRSDLDRLVTGVVPDATQRRAVEVLEGLTAAPPPPPSRGTGTPGSRASSRGVAGPATPNSGVYGSGSSSPVPQPGSPAAGMLTGAAAGGVGSSSSPAGSRGYNSPGSSSSRARRALLSGGSASEGSPTKLQVQGAAAGGSNGGSLAGSGQARRRSTNEYNGSPAGFGSSSNANVGGGNWQAALAASIPHGPPGPMSPELRDAVDQVGLHLGSKDWRNRSDALAALSALLLALPEVPNGPLEGLLDALVSRLSDSNAKVNAQALQVVRDVVDTIKARSLLVLPSLVQALASNLGSTNDRVRAAASAAMDSLAQVVEPTLLMGSLSQVVVGSSMRGKQVLMERLASIVPQVYRYQPQQVVKQVLPAAFAIAMEAKGELRPATAQLLGVLAQLMGGLALLGHAAGVSAAVESKVRDLLPGLCGTGGRGSLFA